MWFIQPKKNYIAQMPWKHAGATTVMSWQIRSRNYNTFVSDLSLIPMALAGIGGAYVASLLSETLFFSLLSGGDVFFIDINCYEYDS